MRLGTDFCTENMNEIASTVRHIFGAWFQDAESPFVATTLLEILSDFVEKAVESESEGKFRTKLDD